MKVPAHPKGSFFGWGSPDEVTEYLKSGKS
jgi:hypothetical protein